MNDLTLICEVCKFPITNDSGSLYARYRDINEKRAAEHDWRERHPAGGGAVSVAEVMTKPGLIRWRAAHDKCRDDRDEDCYEIDVDQIMSWAGFCHWTAHLMDKNWFGLSDWRFLFRELAGESSSRRIRITAREAA